MLCLAGGSAHSQQSDQFESLLTSAQQAQARSDFQTAAEFYRQAVSLHPEIAELKANLGLMYYEIGKNEEAVEAFRQVIRLKPALFVPNLFLGLAYVKLKRFNDAIPYLKRAALSNPADIQAQLGLGQAYAGTANTRLAIRSYLRATETDPGSLMAKFVAARLLIEEGATPEAAGEIQEIWNTDTGFFRANIARFKSGLARPKRSELESVLEEQQAAGILSAEVVALFRDDAGSGPGDQNSGDQKATTNAEPAASPKKSPGNKA